MQRKLDLAMTLMGEPRVIFLDEPTTGLDPRSRRGLWDLVRGLVADGVTILLTTQYLDEADRLADTDRGARRRPDRRPGHAGGAQAAGARGRILLHLATPPALDRGRTRLPRGPRATTRRSRSASRAPADVIRGCVGARPARARRVEAEHIEVTAPDLDDVFLALTSDTRKALPMSTRSRWPSRTLAR